jgi:SAM-dependent methyltransferase
MPAAATHPMRGARPTRAAGPPRCAARRSAAATLARAAATRPPAPASTELPQPPPPLVLGAVEALFKVRPLFDAATRRARATIIERAAAIGVDWSAETSALRAAEGDWEGAIARCVDEGTRAAGGRSLRGLAYPSYYTVPFHAYPQGNLSLDAALEVGVASASVHATVFASSPSSSSSSSSAGAAAPSAPDPRGDDRLRSGYSSACLSLLRELESEGLLSFAVPSPAADDEEGGEQQAAAGTAPAAATLRVVDFGAATGLSSLELARALGPSSHVTGVDLSPHFVAVGRVEMARRRLAAAAAPAPAGAAAPPPHERVSLLHGAIEDTGLPGASFDVVSMCLVAHELPRAATRDALREARRLLKPGGALCLMDMDPLSPAFRRIYSNPFALAAFKSTEPWLTEYVSLDALAAVADAGFDGASVRARACSPRHRAIVATAPLGDGGRRGGGQAAR